MLETVFCCPVPDALKRNAPMRQQELAIRRKHSLPIDYSDRPASYWATGSLQQLLANIKGAERKKRALGLIKEGRLDEATEFVLTAGRAGLSKIHPALLGGEFLPDFEAEEVEIARVTMASLTQDVISIRARPEKGRILYRAVDEYESRCVIRPESSLRPLTLHQLICLFETGSDADGNPIGLGIIQRLFECTEEPADAFADFLTFSSEFYPDLTKHYWLATQRWLAENQNRRIE
jgi:hypothetical protein